MYRQEVEKIQKGEQARAINKFTQQAYRLNATLSNLTRTINTLQELKPSELDDIPEPGATMKAVSKQVHTIIKQVGISGLVDMINAPLRQSERPYVPHSHQTIHLHTFPRRQTRNRADSYHVYFDDRGEEV